MIAPIRDHVDVFSALSPVIDDRYPPRNAWHPKYQSQTGPRKNSTTTMTKDRIEQWMHIFSPISVDVETTTNENEGLHRCFQKVQRRERERHSLYRFLLRLRPDVAYQTRLPEWPAWDPDVRATMLLDVGDLVGGGCRVEKAPRLKYCALWDGASASQTPVS